MLYSIPHSFMPASTFVCHILFMHSTLLHFWNSVRTSVHVFNRIVLIAFVVLFDITILEAKFHLLPLSLHDIVKWAGTAVDPAEKKIMEKTEIKKSRRKYVLKNLTLWRARNWSLSRFQQRKLAIFLEPAWPSLSIPWSMNWLECFSFKSFMLETLQ